MHCKTRENWPFFFQGYFSRFSGYFNLWRLSPKNSPKRFLGKATWYVFLWLRGVRSCLLKASGPWKRVGLERGWGHWKGAKGIPAKGIGKTYWKPWNSGYFQGVFRVLSGSFRAFSGWFQGVFPYALSSGRPRFGSVTGWNASSGSGFRFRRFLCKKGFSVFQYNLTGKDGSGFGSWKTVPVPLSVSIPVLLFLGLFENTKENLKNTKDSPHLVNP